MKTIILNVLFFIIYATGSAVYAESERGGYNLIASLNGDWSLAPASKQEGKATKHKVVSPMVGTDKTAMSFRVIGKGSTVQENLLPGTAKEMATMYHCDNHKNCNQVKATHYCAKQNQPEFVLMRADAKSITFNCNMDTAICKSKAGHVHQIKHELYNGGKNLKTTYTIYKDGKKKKDSVYHFVKK